MGIKDFTKVFASSGTTTLDNEADKDAGIDAYYELFRTGTMQAVAGLVNPAGEPTMHLHLCYSNALKRALAGADDIWVFDSDKCRPDGDTKIRTIESRAAVHEAAAGKITEAQAELASLLESEQKMGTERVRSLLPDYDTKVAALRDTVARLEGRNISGERFSTMILNVMKMLRLMGVRTAIAPPGCDGEKLMAQLHLENILDIAITADTDSTLFGNSVQLKKIPKVTGKYAVYRRADCMRQYGLTERQYIEVGVALGCDFAEKAKGVGPKTVIDKVKSGAITWTDSQKAAIDRMSDRTSVVYEYYEPTGTPETIAELEEWLVTEQGFGRDRIHPKLVRLAEIRRKQRLAEAS